jgi:hypothetical protein
MMKKSHPPRLRPAHLFAGLVLCVAPFAAAPAYAQKDVVVLERKERVATYRPPAAGALVLACNVPDAEIIINNAPRGKIVNAKFSQKLQPGRYKLEVRYPEYDSFTKDIVIAAGRSEAVVAELRPNFGLLKIPGVALRPGQKIVVEVDARPLPDANLKLVGNELEIKIAPPGLHDVRVRAISASGATTGVAAASRTLYNKQVPVEISTVKVDIPETEKAVLKIDSLPTARVYADDAYCGDVSGDGTLVIDKLSPNETHRIRIEAERYRTYETDVTLTTEKDFSLPAKLEAIIEFADNFANLNKWRSPSDWKVDSQILKVHGPNLLGLATDGREVGDIGFRNCEWNFDLRITRGGRAAWVVRARDEKNYYLFNLVAVTPTSAQLETYVCRDGNPGRPVQTDIIPIPLEADKWSHFRVLMQDNKISHFVKPSESPDETSISLFQDRDKTFPYGTVGFTALQSEEFLVGGFVVCPEGASCYPEIKSEVKAKP